MYVIRYLVIAFLIVGLFLLGLIGVPIGLGTIARKRGYSAFLPVLLGILVGPVVGIAGAISHNDVAMLLPVALGYALLIIGRFVPQKPIPVLRAVYQLPLPPEEKQAHHGS